MLTTIFLTLPYSLLYGLFSLLPEAATFPDLAHTAATELGSFLGLLDPIVPIDTFVQILLLRFQLELLILVAYNIPLWLYGKIPFIGK